MTNRTKVRNYRLTFILCHLAKVFDVLILSKMGSFINSTLIDEQNVFKPSHSFLTNSLLFNIYIYVIFTVLKKAFSSTF